MFVSILEIALVLAFEDQRLLPANLCFLLRWIRSVKSAHYHQGRRSTNDSSPQIRLLCAGESNPQSSRWLVAVLDSREQLR
jgi:hypothetical protein